MQVRSITLVRHGRTAYNKAGRIQGWVDIPLDATGQWQVEQTGHALRDLYVTPEPAARQLVVASDLKRAQQSAHAFADPLGLDVHVDERLRERHFGDWEGMSMDELRAAFPDDFDLWMHGLAKCATGPNPTPTPAHAAGTRCVTGRTARGPTPTCSSFRMAR